MSHEKSAPPRILSGVQPSGLLHLGNYFGAIKQHIELQEVGECYYFIANWHSLTTLRDADTLLANTRDVAMTYLAFGLDPERTVFYRQSDVVEIAELTWLLMTVTGMGLLEKAHSYKEKVARGISPSVGLFAYPALMAADILAPQSDLVPVGKDQEQHVELTRDMAAAFNHAFCPKGDPVFKLPAAKFSATPRVPGTTFEKGQVLQVTTDLAERRSDGELVDVASYVAAFRAIVAAVLAKSSDEDLKNTEQLASLLAAPHDEQLGNHVVTQRVLRVASEMPAGDHHVVHKDGKIGIEFCCSLDRPLYATEDGKRVAAKMSKSYGNTIELFAAGKPLKKSVMGIETDLVGLADPLDPTEDIVMELFQLFATDDEVAEMAANYRAGGFGYGRAKQALLAKIDSHFAPYRARREELEKQPDYVEDVLVTGAGKAREVAGATLAAARDACGIPR